MAERLPPPASALPPLVRARKALRRLLWPALQSAYHALSGTYRSSANMHLFLLRHGDRPQVLEAPPPARRAVVLAPHPDDEAIGCGGVLRLYALSATPTAVIYMTDGRRGDPTLASLSRAKRLKAEAALVEARKREAAAAAALLGVGEAVFLDLPDGEMRATEQAVARLRRELARLQPEIVFLPFFLDQHPDHLETNVAFLKAASGLHWAKAAPECWAYETRTPLYASRVVDIRSVAETKWQALACYASQNQHMDYLWTTKGLNSFRWIEVLSGSGYAEAFYACSLEAYRGLFRRFSGRAV